MSEQKTNNTIIIFSCLLFLLMAVHITGIIKTSENQVTTEVTTMSAFNG